MQATYDASTRPADMRTFRKRFEKHKKTICGTDFILGGTLLARFIPCGKKQCGCYSVPPRIHGPYYQWTSNVNGKTVTIWLPQEMASGLPP